MRKLGLLIVVLSMYLSGFSATYYVSTSGSDNNNGSSGSPYRTIAKAASVVNAGDVVLISGGTYSEKDITPKSSGSEGKYIIFKPNPGSGAVTVKHPATSVDDKTPVFQLSNRSYIWIEGLQFKDFSYGLASIYMNNSTGNVVINNRFENLGHEAVASWNQNQVVAVFNGVRNAICNNYFSNIYGDGVNLNSQKCEYNLVCNNTFLGFKGKLRSWGGSYLYSRAIDIQDMAAGNNVAAFNYAEDVMHHIWLDRDGSYNVILRNYGKTGSGNVFNESRCRDNVIQENISVGMTAGYMTSFYSSTSWTMYPRFINNIAYNNTDGFDVHKSAENEFRNNISYNNSGYNIKFSKAAYEQDPHIFKNNLWYSSSKSNSILFNHIPQTTPSYEIADKNGVTITLPAYGSTSSGSSVTSASFQSSVGETNGLSENPMFTSASGDPEGFVLQSGSPCAGAGENGVDIGAFACVCLEW